MIHELSAHKPTSARRDRSLQLVLWLTWTLAVAGTALFNWYTDVATKQPVDLLGLVIYTALAGTLGLIVMTIVELWLEPQRFLD